MVTTKQEFKTPAQLLIEQEVEQRGPMTFAKFVELALYHPLYGYYSQSTPQRGKAGDYFTSFQVSPLFSDILADTVIQMRDALDSDSFTLLEFGSGDGEFLERLCKTLFERKELKGMRIVSVEASRSAREKILKKLSRFAKCEVVADIEDIEIVGGLEGCVFSNEFFDALPFHRYRFDGSAFREIFVGFKGGKLVEEFGSVVIPNSFNLEFIEGQEIEFRPSIPSLYEKLGDLFFRGFMLTFDYGYPRPLLYSIDRTKGSWLCYHKHTPNQKPFENVGRQDITAHVDFTQLAEAGRKGGFDPMLFASQGIFLTHAGQTRIETFLKEAKPEEQRQRVGAIQQLLHPSAMGEAFWVLMQSKAVEMPEAFKNIPNRLRRLGV